LESIGVKGEKWESIKKSLVLRFEVIYGDTDSCKFVIRNLDEVLDAINGIIGEMEFLESVLNEVVKRLNATYDDMAEELIGTRNHWFKVKAESISKRYAQWGAKKRYVCMDYDGEIKATGVEIVRSDTSEFVRDTLFGVFKILLNDGWAKEIAKYINAEYDEITRGIYDGKLAIGSGYNSEGNRLKKFIDWANENLGKSFKLMDKVFYFYILPSRNKPNPPRDGKGRHILVLEWGEVPGDYGYKIDYEAYKKEITTMKTIKSVFTLFGTTYEDASSGFIQSKIDGWF